MDRIAASLGPRHLSWKLVLVAIIAAVVGLLARLASFPRPSDRVPSPNGIDILGSASFAIKVPWPKVLHEAYLGEIRAFIDRNGKAYALARSGLDCEALVHFPDTEAGLWEQTEVDRKLSNVAQLLGVEQFALTAEGRIEEAWRSNLDVLRVGQAGTQGGLIYQANRGWGLQRPALVALGRLGNRLTAANCRALLAALDDLDARRVTPEAIVARWDRWSAGGDDPMHRASLPLNRLHAAERASKLAEAQAESDQIARPFRFLMVQLAVHAYHLERKKLPRSIDDLVPAYLSRMPIDPTTGQPVDYPKMPEGDLADDLDRIETSEAEEVIPRAGPG